MSVDLDGHGLAQNSNPWCVQASGVSLPLRSQSVDLVVTDNVFEHLDEPLEMLAECRRVLKDGGAIVFLCPNGYGYIALISRLTPHWVHAMFKRRALGVADEDTFPTYYRLNSKRAITRLAGQTGFEVNTLQSFVGWPTYWEFSEGLHRVFVLVHALLEKLPLWSHVSLVGVLRTKARRAPDRGEQ
ncbi:MAG: class I SAM-dependent methyltransferase [Desulfomonile tiedjei]|nr:class I SAM-dependent methyltransferase [Desulfomonile tiedjei]